MPVINSLINCLFVFICCRAGGMAVVYYEGVVLGFHCVDCVDRLTGWLLAWLLCLLN